MWKVRWCGFRHLVINDKSSAAMVGKHLFAIFVVVTNLAFGEREENRPKGIASIVLRTDSSHATVSGVRIKADSLQQSSIDARKAVLDDIEFEFGSLIVDETQTKVGHDFYDLFYANWAPPGEIRSSTIVVSEKTLPRLGTQVTVRINDTEVFQSFIQPRFDVIEEMAVYAVGIVLDYLMNYEEIQQELQGKDMQGSGIF
jgi:curli production assembly/transport component CsgE